MSKLIRFDEDHYGYLVDYNLDNESAHMFGARFANAYPGKRLIVMEADEFIDLTGQFEIVPIAEQEGQADWVPSDYGTTKIRDGLLGTGA